MEKYMLIFQGALAIGSLLWGALASQFTVTEAMILHKHTITPYLHEQLYGVVHQTYLAGEKVYGDGVVAQLNKGQLMFH